MFLETIPENILQSKKVKIRYDCDGGSERCGKEAEVLYKVAKKNSDAHGGKHICRSCQLRANNPARRADVQEKIKQTNLDRYGTTLAFNTPENIEARKKKMFGSKEAIQEIVEKRKKTSLERYGTEHPMHNEEVKKRQAETLQERHGVTVPLKSEAIKKKMQQTNLERYGVTNVAQVPEVRIKMAQTTLERYGVEHYNQLPEMKQYLRKNCKEWLAESYAAGGPSKGCKASEERKEKQRQTIAKLIDEDKWLAGHKNTWRGWYQSSKCKREQPFFRSGFELIYHFYLDNNESVEWYDYEPFSIPYTKSNGTLGAYHPDFLIKMKEDPILYVREVKADYLHDSKETQAKYIAAIEYVSQEDNMDFGVLLKQDIYDLGIDFEQLLKHPNVEIIHNPREQLQ